MFSLGKSLTRDPCILERGANKTEGNYLATKGEPGFILVSVSKNPIYDWAIVTIIFGIL